MYLIGSLLSIFAAIFYSLRYSFVKDLTKFPVSKTQLNFYYRLFSFPFIILILIISKEDPFQVSGNFLLAFIVALFFNVGFGIMQVHVLQKNKFSDVESLTFLDILFTTISGLIFFNEIINLKQTLAIIIIISAFLLLYISEKKTTRIGISWIIIFYYAYIAIINIVNKQAVNNSSPILYTFFLTFGLIIVNFILAIKVREKFYRLHNKQANKLLLLVGITAALAFTGVSYGYKLLPVGIVSALISMKTFISLWISYKKYNETNLKIKVLASIIAFIGTLLLFI